MSAGSLIEAWLAQISRAVKAAESGYPDFGHLAASVCDRLALAVASAEAVCGDRPPARAGKLRR
jgi:hypothetical protein